MMWERQWYSVGWFQGKLALVILMSAVHGYFARSGTRFRGRPKCESQKFYRIINEVPTSS